MAGELGRVKELLKEILKRDSIVYRGEIVDICTGILNNKYDKFKNLPKSVQDIVINLIRLEHIPGTRQDNYEQAIYHLGEESIRKLSKDLEEYS